MAAGAEMCRPAMLAACVTGGGSPTVGAVDVTSVAKKLDGPATGWEAVEGPAMGCNDDEPTVGRGTGLALLRFGSDPASESNDDPSSMRDNGPPKSGRDEGPATGCWS